MHYIHFNVCVPDWWTPTHRTSTRDSFFLDMFLCQQNTADVFSRHARMNQLLLWSVWNGFLFAEWVNKDSLFTWQITNTSTLLCDVKKIGRAFSSSWIWADTVAFLLLSFLCKPFLPSVSAQWCKECTVKLKHWHEDGIFSCECLSGKGLWGLKWIAEFNFAW